MATKIGYPSLEKELLEMMEKYGHLVWYARSGCNLRNHKPEVTRNVLIARRKVELKYPNEVETYHEDETGYWQHGFNSGILAALRFIFDAQCMSLSAARDEFPNLDT